MLVNVVMLLVQSTKCLVGHFFPLSLTSRRETQTM